MTMWTDLLLAAWGLGAAVLVWWATKQEDY